MKAIDFPEAHILIAKDQPQYYALPAHIRGGITTWCWRLTWWERLSLLLRGKLWHQAMTYGDPLQPQRLTIGTPRLFMDVDHKRQRIEYLEDLKKKK